MTDIEANKLVAMLFATFPGAKIEPRKQPDGSPTPGGGTASTGIPPSRRCAFGKVKNGQARTA